MSVLIIAEAGVNHNGDLSVAKQLAKEAHGAGADIVKFQTFDAKKLATKSARMTEYQRINLGKDQSQEEMLSKLMLSEEDFIELSDYCKDIGIGFLSSPFDTDSIVFLNNIQNIWKIPSGEITNYPYLIEIAQTHKRILLSTGMSSMDEVNEALGILRNNGAEDIVLLHCTSCYPTDMGDVNLRAMITMKELCGCEVGYSDHTQGIEVPIAATAMGASVIEKHITLNTEMKGPDHKASIEPHLFRVMVNSIRNVERALGDGIKNPSPSEYENMKVVRKSIVAAERIKVGEVFTEKNLTTKRPGTGISPMNWKSILGKRAKKDYYEDDLIEE